MLGTRYVTDIVRCAIANNAWQLSQYRQYFPVPPRNLYTLLANAGFRPEAYRKSWPDLDAALLTNERAFEHFVQFVDAEVKYPRTFPMTIDEPGLRALVGTHALSRYNRARIVRALLQAHIDYHPDCVTSAPFWLAAFDAIATVGSSIVICGDSHSLIYRQVAQGSNGAIIPLSVFCGGGSAAGLANPQSRSGYGRKLEAAGAALDEALRQHRAPVPVCFAFGQVDLEFVFNYRRARSRACAFSLAEAGAFCRTAAETYVAWLKDRLPVMATVLGVNPPCVDDSDLAATYAVQTRTYVAGGVAELAAGSTLDEIVASLAELEYPAKVDRTGIHDVFNTCLRVQCAQHGIAYLDCFEELLGDDGCIGRQFTCAAKNGVLQVGARGVDIHIGGEQARRVKANLLKRVALLDKGPANARTP